MLTLLHSAELPQDAQVVHEHAVEVERLWW
jgi:hypothetical protein